MSETTLYQTSRTFASVRQDTLSQVRTNPRLLYTLLYAKVEQLRVSAQLLLDGEDHELSAARLRVNADVAATRAFLEDTCALLDLGADSTAALLGGAVIEYRAEVTDQPVTRLLPAPANALRGLAYNDTYVYAPPVGDYISSDVVQQMFGGVVEVLRRRQGEGSASLAACIAELGPVHLTYAGERSVVTSAPNIPVNAVWVATQERVRVPRGLQGLEGGTLFVYSAQRGVVDADVHTSDTVGGATVVARAGSRVTLNSVRDAGQHTWRLGGYSGYAHVQGAVTPILTEPAPGSYEQVRVEADALLRRLSAIRPRDFGTASTARAHELIKRLHFSVGADYAYALWSSARVREYVQLDEQDAASRDMLARTRRSIAAVGF